MKIKGDLTYLPALVAGALFALFATQLPSIGAGQIVEVSYPWLPSLGIEFAFRLDGLSLLFSLLITGIGAMILKLRRILLLRRSAAYSVAMAAEYLRFQCWVWC